MIFKSNQKIGVNQQTNACKMKETKKKNKFVYFVKHLFLLMWMKTKAINMLIVCLKIKKLLNLY